MSHDRVCSSAHSVDVLRNSRLGGSPFSYSCINRTYSMSTLLEVKNRESFRGYESGYLFVHLLALRVNTSSFSDIIVTDYSSNPNVASDWNRMNVFGGHELPHDLLLHLQMPLDTVRRLCSEFHAKNNGKALFEGIDTPGEENNWIDVSERFCLTRIEVKLRKTVSKLTGRVTNANIADLDNSPQSSEFWNRFLCLPFVNLPGQTHLRPSEVLQRLQGIASEPLGNELTEDPVKIETMDSDLDSQTKLQDILEPTSQFSEGERKMSGITLQQQEIPASVHGQYLHDLPLSQPLQAGQLLLNQEMDNGTQFLTQLPHSQALLADQRDDQQLLSFTLDSNGSVKSHYKLSELNELPLRPDDKIYHTLAIVAGTIPAILKTVCKGCKVIDGELSLTDPLTSSIELIIADTSPDPLGESTLLTQRNSLTIHIASDNLLGFFGVTFAEQLYTQLPDIQTRFNKRKPRRIPLQLVLTETKGGCVWLPQNLTINEIL